MTLRRLHRNAQKTFSEKPEVYPGGQIAQGKINRQMQSCVVIGDLVAVFFDKELPNELNGFFESTWRGERRTIVERPPSPRAASCPVEPVIYAEVSAKRQP